MQIKQTTQSPTQVTLTVVLEPTEMTPVKEQVLHLFQADLALPGFRKGKAPLNLVEKSLDQTKLQTTFLEEAINQSYPQAVTNEKLRPVDRPEIIIKKFVPFTTLEYEAKVSVITGLKLPDYKKIRKPRPIVKIAPEDVQGVLKSLQQRLAEKQDVERASKTGDQLWIDFKGTDAKEQPINGADGKDYPLLLGSNTFIPGFEENLTGLKPGEAKTFTLTFPKDYGVKALASKKVTFQVTVKKVQSVVEPKLDDAFAAKAGPFKTLQDLKDDIKKQLTIEKQRQSDLDYESELVREITQKSKFDIPSVLIDEQVERMMRDLKQNLVYRGQTLQEYLEREGVTEEEYRKNELRARAEERVRASLVLAEIAEREQIEITPEELEVRLQVLKGQYSDPAMQAELNKPEARRDIAARMLSEKTLAELVAYTNKK